MTLTVSLEPVHFQQLDLSPASAVIEPLLLPEAIAAGSPSLRFTIDYPRADSDPRELSEIPEIRLWFIRLDARYPWLPVLLAWKSGELARYVAMLVPHRFSRSEGIQYNPEALEIFVMQKIFVIADWANSHNLPMKSKLKDFAQMLGYELDDDFFSQLSPGGKPY